MQNIEQYLKANFPLKAKEIEFLAAAAQEKEIKKGEFLVQQGRRLNFAFYIEKGLFKQYILSSEGKENIHLFLWEGKFENNLEAMLDLNQKASYAIQALEDSIVYMIPHTAFKEIYDNNIEFSLANNRLIQAHMICARDRVTQLMGENAETRYLQFLEEYGEVSNRLPLSLIAAYVGITRESLSRLRSDLANDKSKK